MGQGYEDKEARKGETATISSPPEKMARGTSKAMRRFLNDPAALIEGW
jgi:hypothetical protein